MSAYFMAKGEKSLVSALIVFLALVPVNWALGTTLPFCFALSAYFLVRKKGTSIPEILLIFLACAFFVSMLRASFLGETEFSRVAAAIYNIAVVVCAYATFSAGRSAASLLLQQGVLRTALWKTSIVIFSISCLYIIAASTFAHGRVQYGTLILGRLPPLPGILDFYRTMFIANVDWTGGRAIIRPVGFGIYYTEGAILLALSCFVVISNWKKDCSANLEYLILAVCAVVLYVMASRTILAGFFLATFIYLFFRVPGRGQLGFLLAIGCLIAVLLVSIVTQGELLSREISATLAVREGSSNARLNSYRLGIEYTLKQSPLFGLGVKPRLENTLIPVGSHSSFISSFTKGGFLSLFLFVTLFLSLFANQISFLLSSRFRKNVDREVQRQCAALCGASTIVLLWFFTEDFDAPISASILCFWLLGQTWGALSLARRMGSEAL